MSTFYPIIIAIVSFVIGVGLFFLFQPQSKAEQDHIRSSPTENIDKLINNQNKGKSGMQYRNNLQWHDIKYIAWRAGRNGEAQQ